jgi:hypothetical protein
MSDAEDLPTAQEQVAKAIREQAPELLPKIRQVLEEAEAAGAASPEELRRLRVKLEDAEKRLLKDS